MPAHLLRLALLALLAFAGCQGDVTKLNEANPYFQQGIAAQERGRADDAIKAFEECLKFSPGSDKAHLQLAVLYEDSRKDLPRAIVHYQSFLALTTDAAMAERIRKAMQRSEEAYYYELQAKYAAALPASPDAITPPAVRPPVAGRPQPISTVRAPPPPAKPAVAPPPIPTQPVATATYTVVAGDTLYSIAAQHLGSADRWEEIYKLNKALLPDPKKLKLGMKLRLPPK